MERNFESHYHHQHSIADSFVYQPPLKNHQQNGNGRIAGNNASQNTAQSINSNNYVNAQLPSIEQILSDIYSPRIECAIAPCSTDSQGEVIKERIEVLIDTTSPDYFRIPKALVEVLNFSTSLRITYKDGEKQTWQMCQIELYLDYSLQSLTINAIVDDTIKECCANYKFFEDTYCF